MEFHQGGCATNWATRLSLVIMQLLKFSIFLTLSFQLYNETFAFRYQDTGHSVTDEMEHDIGLWIRKILT